MKCPKMAPRGLTLTQRTGRMPLVAGPRIPGFGLAPVQTRRSGRVVVSRNPCVTSHSTPNRTARTRARSRKSCSSRLYARTRRRRTASTTTLRAWRRATTSDASRLRCTTTSSSTSTASRSALLWAVGGGGGRVGVGQPWVLPLTVFSAWRHAHTMHAQRTLCTRSTHQFAH